MQNLVTLSKKRSIIQAGWPASGSTLNLKSQEYWGISCNREFCFKATFRGTFYSLYAELVPWSYLHRVTKGKFFTLDPLLNKIQLVFTDKKLRA